jgi:hypothetical protein
LLALSRATPAQSPDFRKQAESVVQEGLMKARVFILTLLVVGAASVGTVASRGQGAAGSASWTLVNFVDPVRVLDHVVMGPVMIVHDDQKMEQGEACTTFYRFDPARGPREELLSFHCTPVQRRVATTTHLTVSEQDENGCKRLLAYQIAGESEAHAIPIR